MEKGGGGGGGEKGGKRKKVSGKGQRLVVALGGDTKKTDSLRK